MHKYPPCISSGAKSVLTNVGLSFRVTGQDLAAGGVLVELCDNGNSTKNPVATGIIPEEVTLQLLRRSGPNFEAHSTDGPSIGVGADGANSGIDTEVRCLTTEDPLGVRVLSQPESAVLCVPPGTRLRSTLVSLLQLLPLRYMHHGGVD